MDVQSCMEWIPITKSHIFIEKARYLSKPPSQVTLDIYFSVIFYYNPRQNLLKKLENPVNSRNDSIFQIPNSSPYPPILMLNLAKFSCQKLCQQHWFGGERGFFTEKLIFYFVSTFLSKIVGYWYFLRKPSQIAQWCWNACWCTARFKFEL